MLQLGGLPPQFTPGTHLTAGKTGAMRVKFFAQGNNNTKVYGVGVEPAAFQLAGQYPDHLAMLPRL